MTATRYHYVYFTALLLYMVSATVSRASMLVSFDRSYSLNSDAFDDPLAFVGIRIGYFMFGATSPLFDTLTIRPENEGQTYSISSLLDDPDYDGFTALFTNGQSEQLGFSIIYPQGGSSGQGISESGLFSGTAPDAIGYQIESYAITVSRLSLDEPSNTYTFDYSFQAYGTPIPEPGTLTLLSLGALTFCIPARKWRIHK